MGDINLNIKLVAQTQGKNCWEACAEMILAFRGFDWDDSVMEGNAWIKEMAELNAGVFNMEIPRFAKEAQLNSDRSPFVKAFDSAGYEYYLKTLGPLMFFIMKTQGGKTYGHAVVVFGLTKNSLVIADPEELRPKAIPVDQFNAMRSVQTLYILYLKPT